MAYTEFSVNGNARKTTAGPLGKLKGKPLDKNKTTGSVGNLTGSSLPRGAGGGKGGRKGGR
jgi:hypothetical protein